MNKHVIEIFIEGDIIMSKIKKYLFLIILILLPLIFNIYTISPLAVELTFKERIIDTTKPLRVSARNAIAFDSKTKEVLWNQNGYEIVPMASTTKILTAIVAINYGNLDQKIVISKNAASIRGSVVGYKAGEEITIRELLFGLMFRSGNDAAIAIAEGIAGSVEAFSNVMNDYAKSLGVLDSHFESPHGLDSPKHYSSAYDLALLTAKGMEYDIFREIVGEKVISKEKYNFTRDYQNINKILYRIPSANGVKTGYTGGAGKCLVSSFKHNDRNIIIVVLNCPNRWNETEKIYNYIIENQKFEDTANSNTIEKEEIAGLGKLIDDKEFTYGYKEININVIEVDNFFKEKYNSVILPESAEDI